jgi:hypothetical protein
MEEDRESRDLNTGGEVEHWLNATYDEGLYYVSTSGIIQAIPDGIEYLLELREKLREEQEHLASERYYT